MALPQDGMNYVDIVIHCSMEMRITTSMGGVYVYRKYVLSLFHVSSVTPVCQTLSCYNHRNAQYFPGSSPI